MKKKKRKGLWTVLISAWALIILLNVLAWTVPGVSDWYIDHITPVWVNTYGRLTGLASFSVGEVLLVLGAVLVVLSAFFLIFLLIFRKRKGFRHFLAKWFRIMLVIVTAVCLLMTLNCSMLYHADSLDPNPEKETRQYTVKELEILRNYIVEQCNSYSTQMERDADGYLVYDGDLQSEAKDALHRISEVYPRLKGYYPDVKSMMFSDLMCQMYMEGYYFPFSMEANANAKMYILCYPECYCHELSHLHGYIYEDDANFLAFLACISSDNPVFAYSGYMSVLNYVANSYYYNAIVSVGEDYYSSLPQTNDLVDGDNIFLTPETWAEVEAHAWLQTETVDKVSTDLTDASLKLNGVEDGFASYSRVVERLLEYYDGILY